jgi:long-chain acyl-CoA synthetase
MNLTQPLHRALACRPDAIATVFGGRRQTFRQFGDRVARLAGALQTLGVQPGDRVGMLALNSDRYLEYCMAVPWAGGVLNAVNIRWSAAEIAYSLDDCDTRVLIVDDQFAALIPELRQRSKSLHIVIHAGEQPTPPDTLSYEGLIARAAAVPDAMRSGSDLAAVCYTGGTTGYPKGVMLAHAGLAVNGLALVAEGTMGEGAMSLTTLPLFHISSQLMLNAAWLVGATHVILPSFTPLGVARAIQEHRITVASFVPTMIQMLVDHPELPSFDLTSLKTVCYGGSPISEAVLGRVLRALPQVSFYQVYGMTELSPIITILRPELHAPGGEVKGCLRSGGRPGYCTEVRIVDEDGREVSRGAVGEITVRGVGVMLGYWGRVEATAQALRNGWMHTGDVGYMDEDGFVFVVDRLKDMIVTGGENVYSAEVEQALANHPAVAACAVIGVPDAEWGERVHAIVVLKPGHDATVQTIRDHCRSAIAGYKCPRSVEFVAALPLSGAGKVLKTRLREPHWAGRARGVARIRA